MSSPNGGVCGSQTGAEAGNLVTWDDRVWLLIRVSRFDILWSYNREPGHDYHFTFLGLAVVSL
jgi:hypothetical protein